jgi:hypothetical protein
MTISTASTTLAGTYTITITGTGGGKTHSCTYTLTVSGLPPAPTPGEIENMAPGDAAENLAASDPESAADTLENVAPEHAGGIIDAAVEAGLTEEFGDILRRMTPSSAASAILNANPANAARVLEWIVQNHPEIAAEIADAGAKEDLDGMASILNETDSDSVATLLTDVFDLPETPKTAADLLGAISLDKSIAVTQILLGRGMYAYVNGMFVHLTDERLNDIWEGLTQQQRDALLPYLSPEVKDRITALKPFPWALVAVVIVVVAILVLVVWQRRKVRASVRALWMKTKKRRKMERRIGVVGFGILLASILVGVAYVLLLYLGYGSTLATILVSIAFFVLLGIVGWIGWTIATTPSPKPNKSEQ